MSQYFVQINSNLFDSVSVSANIATFDAINCKIEGIPSIKGVISSTQTITAKVQIPNVASVDVYDGQYEIDPKANVATILDTSGKTLLNDIVIKKIPYFETSNLSGYTAYIASEVD